MSDTLNEPDVLSTYKGYRFNAAFPLVQAADSRQTWRFH